MGNALWYFGLYEYAYYFGVPDGELHGGGGSAAQGDLVLESWVDSELLGSDRLDLLPLERPSEEVLRADEGLKVFSFRSNILLHSCRVTDYGKIERWIDYLRPEGLLPLHRLLAAALAEVGGHLGRFIFEIGFILCQNLVLVSLI